MSFTLKVLALIAIFIYVLKGDSGGPLIIEGRSIDSSPNPRQCQAGITSFGASIGCQQGMPAGFSRVSDFLDDFITKETGVLACNECAEFSLSSTEGLNNINHYNFLLISLISCLLSTTIVL